MRGSGATLELARLAPRRQTSDTWNRVFQSNEKFVDQLCSKEVLSHAKKFADFEKGKGHGLCSCLDNISLDDGFQFLRLFGECNCSWKAIENLCKVAYQSESLYRWVSQGQWLRTVSEAHPRREKAKQLVFRSNLVPRGEYLRVAPANGIHSADQGCTAGFFRISEGDPRSRHCRGKCDLAEQLKQTGDYSRSVVEEEGVRSANELLPPLEERPELVRILGEGSDGTVSIISYRKGLFARKIFLPVEGRANPNFVNELEVAKKVLHPNIVHCFSSTESELALSMELLQEDLEGVLQDKAREGDLISFRDSLLVLLQIAKAMKHLHDMDFVHGDLKPGNIFVSRLAMSHLDVDDRFYLIKVGDFGRTQRVDTSFRIDMIGTMLYTAPEVFKFRAHTAPEPSDLKKLDVYSFGVVAYQVLTGIPVSDLGKKKKRPFVYGLMHPGNHACTSTKFSRDGVMKEDGDQAQWRPSCLSNGPLSGDRGELEPLVKECWSSSPRNRPDFSLICVKIQSLFDERFPSDLGIPNEFEAADSGLDVAGQATPMDH